MHKKLILSYALALISLMAYSTGPFLSYQGYRGSGMIFTQDTGAATLWFNPATSHIPMGAYSFNAGMSFSQEYTVYQMSTPSVYQASTINPLQLPWYFNFSAGIHEKVTLGLAINTSWFSRVKWQEENWAGRYIVRLSQIRNTSVQPSVTYQINNQWYVGAGVLIINAAMDYSRSLTLRDQNGEGHMEINGETVEWGVNTGIFFQPNEKIQVGLSYKSAVNLHFTDSRATFQIPSSLDTFFPENNNVSSNYHVPAVVDLHASARLSPVFSLSVAAGLQWYPENTNTTFDFSQNNTYLQDFLVYRADKAQFVSRMGGEYKAADFLWFRAGIHYQDGASGSGFFSPDKPEADRIGIAGGLTLIPLDKLSLDINFAYMHSPTRHKQYIPADFSGNYKSTVYTAGIGISYRL